MGTSESHLPPESLKGPLYSLQVIKVHVSRHRSLKPRGEQYYRVLNDKTHGSYWNIVV